MAGLLPRITARLNGDVRWGTITARVMGLHVETIGTKLGGIQTGLPHFFAAQFHRVITGPAVPGDDDHGCGRDRIALSATVADRMGGEDKIIPTSKLASGRGSANIV